MSVDMATRVRNGADIGIPRASDCAVSETGYRGRMARMRILVKPGSRRGPLVEEGPDGVLTVHVRERAVDGAANEGAIVALADHLSVKRREVRIVTGHTARIKTVEVDD